MRPVPAHAAPTIAMKPISLEMEGDEGLHSAPTVPMKAIRLPVEDIPQAVAVPAPEKAPEKAPRPRQPPAPVPVERPAATSKQPPAPVVVIQKPAPPAPLPQAASPAAPPAATSAAPVPSGANTSAPAKSPAPQPGAKPRPPEPTRERAAVVVEVTLTPPAPAPEPQAPEPPRKRPGQSTSVMLRAGKLHELLDQTQGAQKNARPSIPLAAVKLTYDGTRPAEGLASPRSELALVAPVQSYPGQRTVLYTQNVINQYAVASNPRYYLRPQEPREAAHLFVFDVMSSQHTSLGKAFPARAADTFRPGTLVEIWKWLNETARSKGWRPVEGSALLEAMGRGLPIIAMADTPSGPRLAVVEPGPPGPGGKPRLASAHEPRGQGRTPEQVFGAIVARYLAHD
ncbi:hypothetical protein [Hyalangium rubrum]|uniref:Uncharacterized protein n=1 Tax=Hyalangium rubrum TaxID=3103134 RepID=A0ABU5HAC5_9BACT|nr:hypothetical protein [Hyalangium sp. s54d21]MDY7230436.1 hypothetical protein [Hyalangium sp. s54d21]